MKPIRLRDLAKMANVTRQYIYAEIKRGWLELDKNQLLKCVTHETAVKFCDKVATKKRRKYNVGSKRKVAVSRVVQEESPIVQDKPME